MKTHLSKLKVDLVFLVILHVSSAGPCTNKDCNNGKCDGNAVCNCDECWWGEACDRQDTCCWVDCTNGGVCSPQVAHPFYTCACPSGFSGIHCQNVIKGAPCSSNKDCIGTDCGSANQEGFCKMPEFTCDCRSDVQIACQKHTDCYEKCARQVGLCGKGRTCACFSSLSEMLYYLSTVNVTESLLSEDSDDESPPSDPKPDPPIEDPPTSDKQTCGQRPAGSIEDFRSAMIVGGKEAVPFQWPSICALGLKLIGPLGPAPFAHQCGSTLVKNSAGIFSIVSAAHCFFDCYEFDTEDPEKCVKYKPSPREDWEAWCGIHKISGDLPSNKQEFKIAEIIIHEKYKAGSNPFDIAVLKLDRQPVENSFVQAACLATSDHTPGEGAIVAGWGALQEKGAVPDALQQLYVPIEDDQYCTSVYPFAFEDSMVCAGYRDGGRDSCQGDSGALFTLKEEGYGRWWGLLASGQGVLTQTALGSMPMYTNFEDGSTRK